MYYTYLKSCVTTLTSTSCNCWHSVEGILNESNEESGKQGVGFSPHSVSEAISAALFNFEDEESKPSRHKSRSRSSSPLPPNHNMDSHQRTPLATDLERQDSLESLVELVPTTRLSALSRTDLDVDIDMSLGSGLMASTSNSNFQAYSHHGSRKGSYIDVGGLKKHNSSKSLLVPAMAATSTDSLDCDILEKFQVCLFL